jgi:Xaa-Pro aminopeptidase
MWREGYDFGHGTGHGVGHVLGVHEGPAQIRKNNRKDTVKPILAGHVITDEPGIYV